MSIQLDEKRVLLITDWAAARNLIKGATAVSQHTKLVSELGEWAEGVIGGNRDEIIDGLGDAFVVLTIMAEQVGSNIVTIAATGRLESPEKVYHGTDLSLFVIAGRLGDALAKNQSGLAMDEMFSLVQGLRATATRYGLDLNTCIDRAYNDIKDRQGVMYNGIFVKSTDPRYSGIILELAGEARMLKCSEIL